MAKALHLVEVETEEAVPAHLARFADIYEATAPTESPD
jgi:hypothetical protein